MNLKRAAGGDSCCLYDSLDDIGQRKLLVGGSIGPYGAYLRDGSEYSGNYMDSVSGDELDRVHIPRLRALINGGADVLNVETVPSVDEAVRVLDFLQKEYPSAEVWLTFSVNVGVLHVALIVNVG